MRDRAVVFSADGARLGSVGSDGVVRIWDTGTGEVLAWSDGAAAAAFSGGARIAIVDADGVASVWEQGAGTQQGRHERVRWVAFSPGGPDGAAAIVYDSGTVHVWSRYGDGEPVTLGHGEPVERAVFTPDGRGLATVTSGGSARIWDVRTGASRGEQSGVSAVAFSPDGACLVTGDQGGTVRLWEPHGRGGPATLVHGSRAVVALAFSPDGTRLASVCADGLARVWDFDRRTSLAEEAGIAAVAFSPDGTRLATADVGGGARLWDLRTSAGPVVLGAERPADRRVDGAGLVTAWADGVAGRPEPPSPWADPWSAHGGPETAPVAPQPKTAPPPSPISSRAAALLNLSGLCAGYLAMGRTRRAAVHGFVLLVLVAAGFAVGAAAHPILWGLAFGGFVAWTTWDAWRLAGGKGARPEVLILGRPPAVVAGVLIVAVTASLVLYGAAGRRAFAAGLAAHRNADCDSAAAAYQRVTGRYELTLSSVVRAADAGLEECRLFLAAGQAGSGGAFDRAVESYEAYRRRYPDGLLREQVDVALAQSYEGWGQSLRDTQQFEQAIGVYEAFLAGYANTSRAPQIRGALAAAHADFAGMLRERAGAAEPAQARDLYVNALRQYGAILADYPDTPISGGVPAAVAAAYNDATRPVAEGRFCDALPVLEGLAGLGEGPIGDVAARAGGTLPQALYECGAQRYRRSEFGGAIELFNRLASDYGQSSFVTQARPILIAAKMAEYQGIGPTPEDRPLPPADRGPGAIVYEVVNYAPGPVTLLYSGPHSDEVMIPACPSCVRYTYPDKVPDSCHQDRSAPRVTLRLPAGTYDFLGYYGADVEPHPHTEAINRRFSYSLCVYIQTGAPRLLPGPFDPIELPEPLAPLT